MSNSHRVPLHHRLSAIALMLLSAMLVASISNGEGTAPAITLPDDFRATRVHLGSWFIPEAGASGFHDVYANAEAVEGYRKTGRFPDGSVLVKELRAHVAGNYTTGAGVAHATESVKQWFVLVKDATNRHADDPRWGEGWGWGLFKTDDPGTNVVTDYKADCLGCHVPAKANDWVYIEGYPTLVAP